MGMKITKTNDKKVNTPKKNQNKKTKVKTKNTKCVRSKHKQIFIAMK
jgi:hypothetical protein